MLTWQQATLALILSGNRNRKREFLDEMNRLVPWPAQVRLITPHAPSGMRGRI
jgi:IS5 family transposase